MKFRTDFVTNSSSSSFCVSIEIMTDAGKYQTLLDSGGDPYGEVDMACLPEDILKAGSVEELMELLRNAVYAREHADRRELALIPKADMTAFTKTVAEQVTSLEQIRRIRLTRHWCAYGEDYSGFLWDEEELQKLATAVHETEGAAHDEAIEALREYMEQGEAYAGVWPSGFMGGEGGGKYVWEGSLEDLAERICSERIEPSDDAVEVVDIDLEKKTVERSAEYYIKPLEWD